MSKAIMYKVICSLTIFPFDQGHINLITLFGPLISRYVLDLEMTLTVDPKPSCVTPDFDL